MHDELTKKDIAKMREELDYRRLELMPQLIEEVKRCRAFGDLSENFEYKAAKQAQNKNRSRIRYLEGMIKSAKIISDRSAEDEVGLFDKVEIYIPEDDETQIIQIVTTVRTDPRLGLISKESPFGKSVLGRKVGESITVCDGAGNEYACTLEKITDETVTAAVTSRERAKGEMPFYTVLYQALPKGDKMDLIVQKAVEEGACEIVPFLSERCVSRPDDKSLAKKCARWQRIALEAAKQCGRGVIPKISEPLTMRQMLARAEKDTLCCFCYEGAGTSSLKTVLEAAVLPEGASVSVVVGSEGGFSEKEAADAAGAGLALCGLGPRILRCESASGYALACLSYVFEL